MDELAKLNLYELPEQQTRICPTVSEALQTNPDIRLGFDACCTCAAPLKLSDKIDKCCKICKRVWYCSKECRRQDSERNTSLTEEEEARGHSSVICHLLRLCEIDEQVEDPKASSSSSSSSSSAKKSITNSEKEAAKDRITSEFESYPATLNILMDAPCFQPILSSCNHGHKKRSSSGDLDLDRDHADSETSSKSLTIHIIGASEEAELWGDFKLSHESCKSVHDAYTEAMTELASNHTSFGTINLIFIGPNCPKRDVEEVRTINVGRNDNVSSSNKRKRDGSRNCKVILQTHRSNYDEKCLKKLPKPDFCVFFNPGFTCPDYNWNEALDVCLQHEHDSSKRIPFLVTTNTEMEAISDLQYLHQNGYIDDLPATVADIVNAGIAEHDNDIVDYNDRHDMFFGENPNSGTRVRQSGNMANDLFVKNRWIYGGLFSADNIEDEGLKKNSSVSKSGTKKKDDKLKKKKEGGSSSSKSKKKKNSALM